MEVENANVSEAQRIMFRYAVVTGGNKGIGLEICRRLASEGIVVVLTARDEKKGAGAVEDLKVSGLSNVVLHQLDVKDAASIASLARFLQTEFGKLDILVNNAGESGAIIDDEAFRAFILAGGTVNDENAESLKFMVQTYDKAANCVKTNYYGTKGVTEALLPLLQLSGSPRIVNVSSRFGLLRFIKNERARSELEDVERLSEDAIDKILQMFLRDFKEDKLKANGWPTISSAYRVSKAAINGYTRILARRFPRFRVNCVHPGRVKTDLTYHMGNLTPEEGARAPVVLALLPDDGPSGLYFDEMNASSFQ
ncbi:salutaridine reductase-like isoform X1 [Diospyros lotus]|uniref:salutaridine reductase-like isoform X1 n=1 Tax=Diospyros lotus TaxID=55363 RepID=UPI002259F255|nr:salutaridine reductase-like isoform X1 [Diospyros lotus]